MRVASETPSLRARRAKVKGSRKSGGARSASRLELDKCHKFPDVADGRGDRVARGQEVLSHGILLILEQLGAENTDKLYGDAAGLRLLVRYVGGFAVREPHQRREDTRLSENSETRMLGQVGQHLKLGNHSSVRSSYEGRAARVCLSVARSASVEAEAHCAQSARRGRPRQAQFAPSNSCLAGSRRIFGSPRNYFVSSVDRLSVEPTTPPRSLPLLHRSARYSRHIGREDLGWLVAEAFPGHPRTSRLLNGSILAP